MTKATFPALEVDDSSHREMRRSVDRARRVSGVRRALGVGIPLAFALLLLASAAWAASDGAAEPLTWEQYRDHLGVQTVEDIEASPVGKEGGFSVNVAWTLLCGVLVFWMQAGFALVESGFTRAKNAVNILMKNYMDFCVGSLMFFALGFGLMFGVTNGFFGTTGFFLHGLEGDSWNYTFFFFQTMFAGTAATIASGAMAERTKFSGYLVYSAVMAALIYPIFGGWVWGGLGAGAGWLEAPEGGLLARIGLPRFIDFAGSTVVHSIGGWMALAGVVVLGPRIGKYGPKSVPLPGHSMALATLGVFILWMGWFGFNPGSTTGLTGGTEPYAGAGKAAGAIAVTTNLSACAGAVLALATTWLRAGKPEISMALNGALAGLVGITAGCANVSPVGAVVIGAVAGVVVVFSVEIFDRIGIDDPVGAVSVHGVCGAWGTIAAGLFNAGGLSGAQVLTQVIGVFAAFVWSFGCGWVLFKILSLTIGLRVSEEDEIDGLDLSEHGGEAYPREVLLPQEHAAARAAE